MTLQTNFYLNPKCKYIAFYKPFGVLSQFTKEPNSDKRTLAEFSFPKNVYPLGRLDYDSEGLLLLTDDGRMNKALLDPENEHKRKYLAQVERIPQEEELEKIREGLPIEKYKTKPAKVRILADEPQLPQREIPIRYRKNVPTAWLELELTEGKNRQVRKMTAAAGYPTLRLVRISIGQLNLLDLSIKPGQWLQLTDKQMLQAFV